MNCNRVVLLDENDPATGTVNIGNGRLGGWGPKPGIANLTDRFEFDRRDRLLSYSGGAASETYDYDAGGMMSASSTQGDSLRFYYDTSDNPQATNLHQERTDLWWCCPTRSLLASSIPARWRPFATDRPARQPAGQWG